MLTSSVAKVGFFAGSAVLVVLFTYISAFYVVPDEVLAFLDYVQPKAVVLGCMLALWSAVCFLGWWLVHTPPAKRALAVILRSLLAFTIGAGAFSGFGWPQIQSVMLTIETGLVIEGAEGPTRNPVVPTVVWGIVGLISIGALYLYAEYLEGKGLIRRVD